MGKVGAKRTLVHGASMVLAAVLWAVPCRAQDFGTGIDAYNRGDFAAAAATWKPLAERGDAKAQYMLGQLYRRGKGVERDYDLALKWFEAAADQGSPSAMYWLGWMYDNKKGMWLWHPDKAFAWYLKAGEAGDVEAEVKLADIYLTNSYTQRDEVQSNRWARQAAQKGKAIAAVWIGIGYEDGIGVARNFGTALAWYKRAIAAERLDLDGNLAWKDEAEHQFVIASALTGIARLYDKGDSVIAQNELVAVKYFREAAEHGGNGAMMILGAIYANGANEQPKDNVQAYMWYTLAEKYCQPVRTNDGTRDLIRKGLDQLDGVMTPDEKAAAKQMASQKNYPLTWTPGEDD